MSPKQVKNKKTPQKGKAKTPEPKKAPLAAAESDSDEDDDSDEDSSDEDVAPPVKATPKGKKATPANGKKAESSDEDDDDEDDDDDDEEETPVVAKPKSQKKSPAPKAAAKADSDSDEDDSDDDEEEMEAEDADSDEEDSDDEEEDSDEEEPATKASKKRKAAEAKMPAKQKKKKAKVEQEDEEEEEEDMDEEEEKPKDKKQKKKERKAKEAKEAAKQKSDQTAEASGVSLFVGNLGDIKKSKLMKFFEENDISVANINHIQQKRIAFVDLADADDLDKGLELNGSDLDGQTLSVNKAKPKRSSDEIEQDKQEKKKSRDEESKVKMFVRNLSEDVTDDMLREHFDNVTEVVRPTLPDGTPKRFGFVFFSTEKDVESAIEEKQGSELGGQALFLDFSGAKSKKDFNQDRRSGGGDGGSYGEKGKSKTLFVGNLSYSVTDESLQEAFPDSTGARVLTLKDDPSKSRGLGFVDFASVEEAEAAHIKMQGEELEGRNMKLDFASERGSGGGGGGGGRGGGRGGFRGGFRGGRGGSRGFRGGGGRGGGGRGGGFRGGRGGPRRGGIQEFSGKRKTFD